MSASAPPGSHPGFDARVRILGRGELGRRRPFGLGGACVTCRRGHSRKLLDDLTAQPMAVPGWVGVVISLRPYVPPIPPLPYVGQRRAWISRL